jgi:hypothetical protein
MLAITRPDFVVALGRHLCVPKIRFDNIDDEDRQGQVVM